MKKGSIITFFSYKGGTGRSMSLSNIAVCLSKHRLQDGTRPRVLMIDWDLEAPGLHHYFRPYIEKTISEKQSLRKKKSNKADLLEHRVGLLDFFESVQKRLAQRNSKISLDSISKSLRFINSMRPEKYLLETSISRLVFLKSGSIDENYQSRVNQFRWDELHERAPFLLQAFAEWLSSQFDYTLIDSRTGETDTSGICTAILPDKVVAVFTPNEQSIGGVIRLLDKAAGYRKMSTDMRPLMIYPLCSRVDSFEKKLREDWRYGRNGKLKGYEKRFEELFKRVYGVEAIRLATYFDRHWLQYVPYYSYGEEIAVLGERRVTDRTSLAFNYRRFSDILVSEDFSSVISGPTLPKALIIANEADRLSVDRMLKQLIKRELQYTFQGMSREPTQAKSSSRAGVVDFIDGIDLDEFSSIILCLGPKSVASDNSNLRAYLRSMLTLKYRRTKPIRLGVVILPRTKLTKEMRRELYYLFLQPIRFTSGFSESLPIKRLLSHWNIKHPQSRVKSQTLQRK